jgi:putative ABC transport system permease protein
VREGLTLAGAGLALGLGAAFALVHLMDSLLYGVPPTDLLTFVAVALCLIAVAVVACVVPARRAASISPMIALRAS